MALGMNGVRHTMARGMDLIGDAANVGLLMFVLAATWASWLKTLAAYHAAGGKPWLPRSEEDVRYAITSVRMLLMDQQRRHFVWDFAANWLMTWTWLVITIALALLCVAGLRWAWVRLRDIIAGV
ncbi:hypothetical protein ACVIGB_000414 [Bradyrhizobium sp. USDA 4341]